MAISSAVGVVAKTNGGRPNPQIATNRTNLVAQVLLHRIADSFRVCQLANSSVMLFISGFVSQTIL